MGSPHGVYISWVHFLPWPPERSLKITDVMTLLCSLNVHKFSEHCPHGRTTSHRNSLAGANGTSRPAPAHLSSLDLGHAPSHCSLQQYAPPHAPSQIFAHVPCGSLLRQTSTHPQTSAPTLPVLGMTATGGSDQGLLNTWRSAKGFM